MYNKNCDLKRLTLVLFVFLSCGNQSDETGVYWVECLDGHWDYALDADEDQYYVPVDTNCELAASLFDCDDNKAETNPGASEVCDFVDNNCSGDTDEASVPDQGIAWYPDCDGDQFGASTEVIWTCSAVEPPGDCDMVLLSGDCNNLNDTIYPGRTETCDGIDEDCDTVIDDGAICDTEVPPVTDTPTPILTMEPPSESPTETPTEPPTETPTEPPSDSPTEPPSAPPTDFPSDTPTQTPITIPPTPEPTPTPSVPTVTPEVTQSPTPTPQHTIPPCPGSDVEPTPTLNPATPLRVEASPSDTSSPTVDTSTPIPTATPSRTPCPHTETPLPPTPGPTPTTTPSHTPTPT